MESHPTIESVHELVEATQRVAQRSLDVGANRLELLMVELQEERDRLLRSLHLALGAAAFGLLAGFAFTFAIVVTFWDRGAVFALFGLTGLYAGAAVFLGLRIIKWQRDWPMFGATLDQLRKDRECLAHHLR